MTSSLIGRFFDAVNKHHGSLSSASFGGGDGHVFLLFCCFRFWAECVLKVDTTWTDGNDNDNDDGGDVQSVTIMSLPLSTGELESVESHGKGLEN